MNDLIEKSLQILELPEVLKLLAAEAVCAEAKERSLHIRPSGERGEAERLLLETDAACRLMQLQGAPQFSGVRPVGEAVRRAQIGGMLNTRELLNVAGVLKAARLTREYGSEDRKEPLEIDWLFRSLQGNRFLEDKIFGAIVAEDEISSSASPELFDIRRHMQNAVSKVREVLQQIISSPHYQKYLQETIITMRNERYVVPVKAECKGEVPGLIHDVSASGATVFIEPMKAVQANNDLRELAAKEKKEIERILAELSALIAEHADAILRDYDLLVRLDCIFARAKLSGRMNAISPVLSSDGSMNLRRARHPLLPSGSVVPIDVHLGGEFDTLVITGPNTGGKTVTLKTIGLLSLMAQCGMHIPAGEGSTVAPFSKILADIGDEQSIEQSLSTFSAHISNIIRILEESDEKTLILMDELGAGTDPVEGAALAIAIIEEARRRGARIAATTHYAELKVYAMKTPGVVNAACEFNVETLRPTYKLLIGVPGKSNAFAIARRLGLSEKVIARAKEQVDTGSLQFEDVLAQLESKRQEMERERIEAARLRREAEERNKAAEEYKARMEQERAKASERAKAEARQIIENTRAASDEIFAQLQEMQKQKTKEENWQAVNEARTEIRRRLNEAERAFTVREEEIESLPPTRPAKPGDTVLLLGIGTKAVVLSEQKDGTLELQAGRLKITAKQQEVRVLAGESGKESVKNRARKEAALQFHSAAPARELDLRGMTVDEAIAALGQFLDGAMLAKVETVTIIHGKGTGALRSAVHQELKNSRYVRSFRLGRYGEGETGVTIAEMK